MEYLANVLFEHLQSNHKELNPEINPDFSVISMTKEFYNYKKQLLLYVFPNAMVINSDLISLDDSETHRTRYHQTRVLYEDPQYQNKLETAILEIQTPKDNPQCDHKDCERWRGTE